MFMIWEWLGVAFVCVFFIAPLAPRLALNIFMLNWFAWVALLLWAEQTYRHTGLGTETAKEIVDNPAIKETGGKLLKLVNKKLEQLTDEPKVEDKK